MLFVLVWLTLGVEWHSFTYGKKGPNAQGPGHATGEQWLETFLTSWVRPYGKPAFVRAEPEGCFRDFQIWFVSFIFESVCNMTVTFYDVQLGREQRIFQNQATVPYFGSFVA